MRIKSLYFIGSGYLSGMAFASIFFTAWAQAGIITYRYYAGRDKALPMWTWLSDHLGPLWSFALWLPFPKTFFPRGTGFAPWITAALFYLCLMLCSSGLLHRGRKLRAAARDIERDLRLQTPIIMSLSAMAAASQSAQVHTVSGTGNVVNATNNINHALHEAEKKSIFDKFWIPLLIAVATAIIQKLLGSK